MVHRRSGAREVHAPAFIRTLRRELKLGREAFSQRYGIPVPVIEEWEQYRSKPDTVARSYLLAIHADPDGVAAALAKSNRAAANMRAGEARPSAE